ncbi:MAG: transcriptional regulator CynR [Acidobacteriota bacterium]
MELRHLRYFLAVAEAGHFTRASEQLHVSQPTLSQQIRQLEEELGAPLFDRIGRQIRLTVAGQTFREHAKRALREVEEARLAIDELEGLKRGALWVGVVQTVNAYLMPEILHRFTMAHGGIQVHVEELTADQMEEGLLEGRLSLGIGFVPAESDEIECHSLFHEDLVLVVPQDHRLAGRTRVRMKELDHEPMVLLSRQFCTRRLIDQCFREAKALGRVRIEMNSIDGILATVAMNGTATILPGLVESKLKERQLCSVELIDPKPRRVVGVLRRRQTFRCAATRAFEAVILEALQHKTKRLVRSA